MDDAALLETLETRLFLSADLAPGRRSAGDGDDGGGGRDETGSLHQPATKLSSHTRTRDIFGRDDRVRVKASTDFPFAAVGQVESTYSDGSGTYCTGALVSAYHVLTAAHCVYDDDRNEIAEWIDFRPGQNGSSKPFGTITSSRIRVDPKYPGTEESANDYALVTLEEPIGEETGWFGYGTRPTKEFGGMRLQSTGYPGDRGSGDEMYHQVGRSYSATSRQIMTRLDVAQGQSGSPVYDGDETIVGVLSASNTSYTYVTRLSGTRFERIQTWIEKDETRIMARERARAREARAVDAGIVEEGRSVFAVGREVEERSGVMDEVLVGGTALLA